MVGIVGVSSNITPSVLEATVYVICVLVPPILAAVFTAIKKLTFFKNINSICAVMMTLFLVNFVVFAISAPTGAVMYMYDSHIAPPLGSQTDPLIELNTGAQCWDVLYRPLCSCRILLSWKFLASFRSRWLYRPSH